MNSFFKIIDPDQNGLNIIVINGVIYVVAEEGPDAAWIRLKNPDATEIEKSEFINAFKLFLTELIDN